MKKLKSKPSKPKSTTMKKKGCKRGHSLWQQERYGCGFIMDVVQSEGGIRTIMCCDIPMEKKKC